METPKELSVRIHYDWKGQCRTCTFWTGDRAAVGSGFCKNEKSDLYELVTVTCGHCPCWDSYDYETALEVLDGRWDHIHKMKYLTDDEFEEAIQKALEEEARTHAGAKAVEEYFAGPYKEEWHRVWQEGRIACLADKSRNDNPNKLKVWRAVWEYGWDNYYPPGM